MKKKTFAMLAVMALTGALLAGCGGGDKKPAKKADAPKAGGKKIVIYTSMKQALIGGIVDGFKKANPGVEVDFQSAGAGKLMAKIAAERQSGKILCDILWTSEVPDFYNMKKEGILLNYKPEALKDKAVLNPFDDYDGSFTAARMALMGVCVNTDKVKTPLKTWQDLFGPDYKNAYGIADPALSGTSYMSIALLEKKFGWDYFQKLAANGARIGKGSGQVIDDTASGELKASLGVDYIVTNKIRKGAHMTMVYPPETLVIPSPICIFKDSKNPDIAKKFLEYMLTKETQTLIAKTGTLPVRTDVVIPPEAKLPKPDEALKKSVKVNYIEILPKKAETIKKFTEIIGKKK